MGFIAGWNGTSVNDQTAREISNKLVRMVPDQWKHKVESHLTPFAVCVSAGIKTVSFNQCLISISNVSSDNLNKPNELVKRYLDKGEKFIENIPGAFTLMLADRANDKLILAIDRFGQHSLYYAQTKNGLVFGSTADSVIEHPEVSSEISLQSIYDYVYFHHCPSPNTIYKQVKKLEGGQVLVYQAGKITIRQYWLPAFSEQAVSIEQSGKDLRQKINGAVKDLSGPVEETGAFLSGGLDSSTVAGALSEVFPGAAKTFSIGFPVEGYDEIEYARIAVERFNTKAHEYYVTPDDTVSAIPKIAAYYDEPFGNSSALAAYYCAKMAKEKGIKVLLAGDGGDELFAGNERYAKQLLFDKYYQLPSFARKTLKIGLYNAPDLFLKNKIIFKAKRYVEQAEIPLPDRLQDYNFLNRHPSDEIFANSFLNEINPEFPLQSLRYCYNKPEQASSLNRMLYMDWKTTLHDNDLVKVNKMCEMAGVEAQYPLLHQSIVDLSCRIPSADKLKGQKLRWFYKQAMRDFLPEPIINKSKHGFGLPFGIWLKDHKPLKELAYDSINSLKKRGYFREDFLSHSIKMHQSIHAAYYGELIWILMMLELWFQAKEL